MGAPIAAARQYFPAPSFPTFIEVSPLIAARTESLGRGITRRVVEFAFPGTVQKALPLVPVEHEHPASWVIGDAHQNPVTVARHGQLMRIIVPASHGGTRSPGGNGFPRNCGRHGDTRHRGAAGPSGNTSGPGNIRGHAGNSYLNGTGSLSRTLPLLSVRVDAELLDRGLGDHGRLATPQ